MASKTLQRLLDHAGVDDWYDAYGAAMNLAFDICEVLNASDIDGDVTPELFDRWAYSPSPHVTVPSLDSLAAQGEDADSWGTVALARALLDGDITQADLIYAGEVMHRYITLLIAAGRDY